MAASKKNLKRTNLKEIPGRPGLYTFVTVTRNPKKEKALLSKIFRDARKLRSNSLVSKFVNS
jgi:hypothetical protein